MAEVIFVSFVLMMFFQILQDLENRFARVIFDVTSSHSLFNQTISKHIKSYEFDMGFVSKVLDYFYVYDISSMGGNDFDNALKLKIKLVS